MGGGGIIKTVICVNYTSEKNGYMTHRQFNRKMYYTSMHASYVTKYIASIKRRKAVS